MPRVYFDDENARAMGVQHLVFQANTHSKCTQDIMLFDNVFNNQEIHLL